MGSTQKRWDLNPVPSIYPDSGNFLPSLLPSVPPRRKSLKKREFPDQISEFKQKDEFKYFSQINETFCPPCYQLKLQKNKAIFYKTENCLFNDIPLVTEAIVVTDSLNVKLFWKAIPVPLPQFNEAFCPPCYQLKLQKNKAIFYKTENCPFNDIPLVTETIVVTDSLNVKLFWKAIPVPLPQWFRKGSNCRLKSKSMLDNFPSYLQSVAEQEPNKLQNELQYIKYKKPENGPKYSF